MGFKMVLSDGDVIVYVEVDQILFCYHGDVYVISYTHSNHTSGYT